MNFDRDEFIEFLGVIKSECRYGDEFVEDVKMLMNLLDGTNEDDYFGTEGWEHYIGWED